MKNSLYRVLQGIALGAGAILPGISSGVLCVIFGLYEKIVSCILCFFKNIKENIHFLLPLGIGGFIGVITFSHLLTYLFDTFPMQTKYAFIGLILGSIPYLIKEATKLKGFRLHYFLYFFVTFLIGYFMLFLEKTIPLATSIQFYQSNAFYLIFCGFMMSIGVVVPGISSSVILMTLGTYSLYLSAISNLQFNILIPMAIGLLLGGFLWLHIIQYCLKHFHAQTYFAIIGFVLGSVLILYTNLTFNASGFISIFLLIFGFYIATKIG